LLYCRSTIWSWLVVVVVETVWEQAVEEQEALTKFSAQLSLLVLIPSRSVTAAAYRLAAEAQ
jgi:hypothetical protein